MEECEEYILAAAEEHLDATLRWIKCGDNNDARDDELAELLHQFSQDLREKFGLFEQPQVDKENQFHRLSPTYLASGSWRVDPMVWRYFDNHHFEMILDVGKESAARIRRALICSGIGREVNKDKGILTVPLCHIKTKPISVCPADMCEARLGDLLFIPKENIADHFTIEDKRYTFVHRVYELLRRV